MEYLTKHCKCQVFSITHKPYVFCTLNFLAIVRQYGAMETACHILFESCKGLKSIGAACLLWSLNQAELLEFFGIGIIWGVLIKELPASEYVTWIRNIKKGQSLGPVKASLVLKGQVAGQLVGPRAGMEGESSGCFGGEMGAFGQGTQPSWVTSISYLGSLRGHKQRAGWCRWVEELDGQVEDLHPGRAGDNICLIGLSKEWKEKCLAMSWHRGCIDSSEKGSFYLPGITFNLQEFSSYFLVNETLSNVWIIPSFLIQKR